VHIKCLIEEKFEKKLSGGLVNLKLELMEKISSTAVELGERITNVESGLGERITKVEAQLNERISTSSEKLRVEIANSKVETIKWMFIFWMANVITIIGGIIGILKIAKVF
jgi:hypothetical protein